jgi:hypothetical protein
VPPPPSAARVRKAEDGGAGSWATLREAAAASGVPISTIRKWARKGRISSRLVQHGDNPLRIVDLDDVLDLARQRTPAPEPGSAGSPLPHPVAPSIPEGHMLVPLDAWDKMVAQLGNLHEAGQQLAEAGERAAKAETEVVFLRERLTELRSGGKETGPATTPEPDEANAPGEAGSSAPEPPRREARWQRWMRRARGTG